MYLSLNELVEDIQRNVERLQNGQMNLEEVEAHLTLVRELYERTVVLKFKALELKSTVTIDTNQQEEPVVIAMESPVEEVEMENDSLVVDKTEEVEFDLFGSMFSDEPTDEVLEEVLTESPVQELETINQEQESTQEIAQEIVREEAVVDLATFEVKEEVVAPIVTEIEKVETASVMEVDEQSTAQSTVPKHLMVFSAKLKEVNAEAANQFGFSPLNTLIGSFGLNERLQYINELFGASSETFSDAVKAFDSLQNLQQANDLILEYANTQMWDVESPAVEEFMHKLCRRYA